MDTITEELIALRSVFEKVESEKHEIVRRLDTKNHKIRSLELEIRNQGEIA